MTDRLEILLYKKGRACSCCLGPPTYQSSVCALSNHDDFPHMCLRANIVLFLDGHVVTTSLTMAAHCFSVEHSAREIIIYICIRVQLV